MARRVATDDDWEDDDGAEPADAEWTPDDEDEDETVPCPHCQDPVHDQAERCPNCGWYISEEDAPPARRPTWLVIGFILVLTVALLWAL